MVYSRKVKFDEKVVEKPMKLAKKRKNKNMCHREISKFLQNSLKKCVKSAFIFIGITIILYVVQLNGVDADILDIAGQNPGSWKSRNDEHPTAEFSAFQTIQPKLEHGRHKRSIRNSLEDNGLHASHLTLTYNLNDNDVILDLQLNDKILPHTHYISYQLPNGEKAIRNFTKTDADLCHYHGKIRSKPDSSVAISTCNGITGVIYDGVNTFYIENNNKFGNSSLDSEHFIYNHADLVNTGKCGYEGGVPMNKTNVSHDHYHHDDKESEFSRMSRFKRSASGPTIRGPYNANKHSSYVELVIVIDNKMFKAMGENYKKVHSYSKDIVNIINALYVPLNIFVGLVGVVIWNETNDIEISSDGEKTLKHFLQYRKKVLVKEHPNDNAQLFTKEHFDGGVVGKALKGPICTYEFSGGVEMYHSNIIGVQATTVAHEMGHNFGMEHDLPECKCPEEKCIMSAASSSTAPRYWSSCSIDQLNLAFHHGMNYCLKNKPAALFESPTCGNGFVEVGEQCDCGIPEFCDNACCDPHKCMLYANASCATGECCDLTTCKPKSGGTECRSTEGECDLPEYCSGESEFCPIDVFKRDTEVCDNGKAFCYKGACKSQNDQCKLLWGPSGQSSDQCYKKNTDGTRHGNCGYDRIKNEYLKCEDNDVSCGMLHCRHLNERLEFGMESVAILSHSFMTYNGSIVPCRSAIVDLGLQKVDPGLTPDGAKCGDGKMCLNQICMPVDSLRREGQAMECPENCNGNGICNSEGHCHCHKGYAPPLCNSPGSGGSEDSGPATDPNAINFIARLMYIVFCGIVPCLALSAFLVFYLKHQKNTFHKRKPVNATITKTTSDSSRSTASTHSMGPSSPNSPDDMNASLLRPSSNDPDLIANSNMFNKFNGYTLKPLPEAGTNLNAPNVAFVHPVTKYTPDDHSNVPNRVAPPPPRSNSNSSFKTPLGAGNIVNGSKLANHELTAPALPPLNPGSTARPIISSPILETSTCTAKELVSPLRNNPNVPTRLAPSPPPPPQITELQVVVPDVLINPCVKEKEKRPKESTLHRFTSFLKKDEKPEVHYEPKMKIDREKLKTIEISAPIPIDEGKQRDESNAVQRAKSMRELEVVNKRTNIQTFGSMRQPLKRPPSIVSSRPTVPPPPVPPSVLKIPGLPGYQNPPQRRTGHNEYDDCADCGDEKVTVSTDNIYSVIEESPSPPNLLSPPVTSSSGSSESMGLLGEIVNEIENRNFDSIYIATLKKDKSKEKLTDYDEPTYVNASDMDDSLAEELDEDKSTTSSGYLKPSAINTPVARVAPSSIPTPSLSSFKPSNTVPDITAISFQGPIVSEQKKTVSPSAPTVYKPYHSTVNSRPGSVFAATKSKINNQNKAKIPSSNSANSVTSNLSSKKPLASNASIRTRTPSPKQSPMAVTTTTTVAKPKVLSKPSISSSSIATKTTPSSSTTTSMNRSNSQSKILSAAARPKTSNVLAMQQKFETGKK